MTKQHQQIVNKYTKSNYYNIFYCYDKPSYEKQRAEEKIFNEMFILNGYAYKVLGYNHFNFSCAYMYDKIDTKTGEVTPTLVYHTSTNRIEINLLG